MSHCSFIEKITIIYNTPSEHWKFIDVVRHRSAISPGYLLITDKSSPTHTNGSINQNCDADDDSDGGDKSRILIKIFDGAHRSVDGDRLNLGKEDLHINYMRKWQQDFGTVGAAYWADDKTAIFESGGSSAVIDLAYTTMVIAITTHLNLNHRITNYRASITTELIGHKRLW